MRTTRNLVAIATATLGFAFAGTAANAADIFTLKSTTFQDGKIMPLRVANSKANRPDSPNCVGDNVSPQFSWTNVPAGTKSFVLTMFDPEGRAPSGVSHWVAYGIPASVRGFAEGEVSKASSNYVGGKSTMGVGHYSGPCTPPNTTPHHYTFHSRRNRLRSEGVAARPDARRADRQVRPGTRTLQGLNRNGGFVCQSLARVIFSRRRQCPNCSAGDRRGTRVGVTFAL